MSEPVKINTLEVENVKRIKAVSMDCTGKALTIVGGRNGQGKTSVLDAIAFTLGGKRYQPSNLKRDDSVVPPAIKLTLSNGITVERKGKNSDLKVTDSNGVLGGQALLNAFVHQFALDLPAFLNSNDKAKAQALLQVIGVGDQLAHLDAEESRLFSERRAAGQVADQKAKFAEVQPYYADAPDALVSAAELIEQQQEILQQNADNARIRQNLQQAKANLEDATEAWQRAKANLARLEKDIADNDHDLTDQDPSQITQQLQELEDINAKVRANLDKAKALEDAEHAEAVHKGLTERLEKVRGDRLALLEGADLPLPGLAVADGALTYQGKAWDCMSGAEQLRVGTAIVRKLNPECGFVLLDKLEQMDLETLHEFGQWLDAEGLQAIATRVSTGAECSIVIADGCGTLEQSTTPKTLAFS